MVPLKHVPREETASKVVLRGTDERGATYKVVIPSKESLSDKARKVGLAHIGTFYAGVGDDLGAVSSLVIPQSGGDVEKKTSQ
jgi:hypothetical protein